MYCSKYICLAIFVYVEVYLNIYIYIYLICVFLPYGSSNCMFQTGSELKKACS